MLWMERLALMIFVLLNLLLFGFYNFITSTSNMSPLYNDIEGLFLLSVYITIPIWLLFRMIDWLFSGPARRQIKKEQLEIYQNSQMRKIN